PDFLDALIAVNKTTRIFQKSPLFFQEFEDISLRNPGSIAILDKETTYTYAALNSYSNQIAHFLQHELNISKESIIALCVDRNADMVAFMLGIMKAGAAYLPLDPNFPADRLQYMLDDA